MKIGIINAGNVGRTMATGCEKAGHELMLAKAGTQDKLNSFVQSSPNFKVGNAAEAAMFGKVSLFSVYWPNLDSTLTEVGDMAGQIVIDTMNPLLVNDAFEHYHDTEFMKNNSTSEELQRRLPKARIVKAFSNMPAQSLVVDVWKDNSVKPPIFLASDDQDAKEIVKQLAEDAGFQTIDVGELVNARSIEQMGVLLHHVAVNQFAGAYEYLAPAFVQASNSPK